MIHDYVLNLGNRKMGSGDTTLSVENMLIVIHLSYPGNNKSIPYVFFIYMDIDVWAWMNDPTADYRQVLAHMPVPQFLVGHYSDVIMSAMASQITSLTIVNWTVCPRAGERKPQSSASLAFVKGIHRWPVNSPHKGLVRRKMFQFDDVIMCTDVTLWSSLRWYFFTNLWFLTYLIQ